MTKSIHAATYVAHEVVEYYSSTHKKWYETTVLRINQDSTLDLACRKNVALGFVRRRPIKLHTRASIQEMKENMPSAQNLPSKHVKKFDIGTRVEYFSDSLNGWVLSYVKGINADGTIQLNTKKSADVSKIRPLVESSPSRASARIISSLTTTTQPTPHIPEYLITIRITRSPFELVHYKGEILSRLGLTFDHSISRMTGFTGGQNEGIFLIQSPQNSTRMYCLKVVGSERKFDSVPTERENYLKMRSKFPELIGDENVTFPVAIFQLISSASSVAMYDVFVMKVARGERMAELIGRLVKVGEWNKLGKIFRKVGIEIGRFHLRYKNTQHADLQCSNIYVDLADDGFVTCIDVGGMGSNVQGKDVDYFVESIKLLGRTYGPEFERIAIDNFSRGYAAR